MEYYSAEQILSDNFMKYPRWLKSIKISSDAKLLYVYLLDRYSLSLKNRWVDDKGHVFLICTRFEMQELLDCAKGTAIKAAKALEETGLIEEKRIPNAPSRIYLLMPAYEQLYGDNADNDKKGIEDNEQKSKNWKSKIWTSKNCTTGSPKNELSEVQNLDPNKNNNNKTNKSKNNILNNITNATDDVVDTHTPSNEEIFDNVQNKISL